MDRAQLHAWLDSYEPRCLADLPARAPAPQLPTQIASVLEETGHRCEEVILPIQDEISASNGIVESTNLFDRPAA